MNVLKIERKETPDGTEYRAETDESAFPYYRRDKYGIWRRIINDTHVAVKHLNMETLEKLTKLTEQFEQ